MRKRLVRENENSSWELEEYSPFLEKLKILYRAYKILGIKETIVELRKGTL